jgi:type I restriction-modification system DNA methylase subunit
MEETTARNLVRETLTQTFDKLRYHKFIRELLNRFDESKATNMAIPDAFRPHVKSCQRIGTYSSPDGELADLLIVNLTESFKLDRTRTALRDFVAHKLKRGDNYKEAGLVAFVAPDLKSWRFSYIRMDYETRRDPKTGKIKVEERLTPARRFSYLVGTEESCHTAQSRFLGLLKETVKDPELSEIEDAFSVEAVTKEFFSRYVALFSDLNSSLEKLVARDKRIRQDFEAKQISTVDFAKKLLGQIVFLYFLQKKGWLGVPKGGNWGDGPKDFLRRLANGEFGKYKNFFNDVLEPLFYDTLATDRGKDAWCRHFNCRIPFLNGGLFEPISDYNWKQTEILIQNKLFTNDKRSDQGDRGTGILDVFDRFNFTVNEAEPLEKDVAIDPEMLGKVFENLLGVKERKSKGSFYTPREIVHYMCQESLINYLDKTLNDRKEIVPRKEIQTFVQLGEQISHYEAVEVQYAIKMPKSVEKHSGLIDQKMADIAICDPAIGSGAFPVGMMQEIVRARSALTPYFIHVHDRTAYHFKRHAIQNCLYGVDIDSGAVEIAKLRLWLSLVVDEEDMKQIKPLPNLDYKVVTGNSLIGVEKDLFNLNLFRRLEELKPRYFDATDRKQKKQIKHDIDNLIHKLTRGKEAFDFEIFFSEVFHKKGGFDVVIGNPPYVTYHGRRRVIISKNELDHLKKYYTCAFEKKKDGKYNSAMFFIEKFVKICGPEGLSCCITDISFYEHFYQGLKKYLLEYTNVLNVVNGLSSFENVVSGQLIIIASKARNKSDALNNIVRIKNSGIQSESILLEQREWYKEENKYQFYLPEHNLDGLYCKFEEQSKSLGHFFPSRLIRTGESIGVKEMGFVVDKPINNSRVPIYEYLEGGKSVPGRYCTPKPTRYFQFDVTLLKERNKAYRKEAIKNKRKNPKVLGIGDKLAFDNPKILIRQSCNYLCCTYTSMPYVYNRSYYSVSNVNSSGSSDANLFYVLALLNSTLFTFYARKKRIIRMEHGKQPQIRLEDIKTLPVRVVTSKEQKPFIELAQKILAVKQHGTEADASGLERKLDKMVYALYGLTLEEIALVEKSC